MSVLEFMRLYWPVVAFLTPLMFAGFFAWLKTQFPTRADLEKLRTDRETAVAELKAETRLKVAEIEANAQVIQVSSAAAIAELRSSTARDIAELQVVGRQTENRVMAVEHHVRTITEDLGRPPAKIDLSKDIGKVAERVGRLEAGLEDIQKQNATTNEYLHTLIEKHLA